MVHDLGLGDAVRPVSYGHPSSTNRMILVKGRLHKLPSSLKSLFYTLPPFTRPLAMSALTDLAAPRVKVCYTFWRIPTNTNNYMFFFSSRTLARGTE